MARKKATNPTSKKVTAPPIAKDKTTLPFYQSGFWKKHWWQALLIFALPILLYYQSTKFGFVLDDQIVFSENNFTKKGFGGISDLLTSESMTGYFGEQQDLVEGSRYRPLSLITFAMEYGIVGDLNPGLSHWINIILYGLTGLLLFRVLTMMLRKRKYAVWWLAVPFLASLFYVAHPIHSEAVANIKGRDEIMALLFSLATLYAGLRYMDHKKVIWLVSTCGLFFLALLSKENSITFLAVIPLTVYFFSEYKWKHNLVLLGALLATTVGYLVLRFSVAGVPEFGKEITDLMNNPFLGMNGGEKLATIMFTLFKYIQLYVFPHPLSHDYYPYAIDILHFGDFRALGSLLLHVGLLIWAVLGLRKKRVSSYAILFYLTTLTIVSNIVINLGTFMNERFIYMSSVGLALLVAHLIYEKIATKSGKTGMIIASAIAGLLIIGYSAKTLTRVPAWESALSLNTSAVANGTNSARANSFMATAIYNEWKSANGQEKWAKLEEGYKYAEKAVKIHPKYQNGNLMKAGIAAELYKKDRNERLLLERFAEVMGQRPDVGFLDEYLDYLENRTNDLDYLLDWYAKTSINEVMHKANLPNWALHYLNKAYTIDKTNKAVLQGISQVYNRLGDTQKANSFRIAAEQAQ